MTDESTPPSDEGISDSTALEGYRASFQQHFELLIQWLDEDIATTANGASPYESLAVRARWHKKVDLMLDTHELFEKRYGGSRGEARLIQELFGDQLGSKPHILPEDVERRLEWYRRRLSTDYARRIRTGIAEHGVKSPIEQVFMMEWYFARVEDRFGVRLMPQQEEVVDNQTYRIDFAIIKEGKPAKIAIELDGHAFHERTPVQAANDRQRERALIRQGYTVLRFTGSEVVSNSRKCLSEVVAVIEQAMV